ncbi:MAG TPA: T9SS type A sorting domain-containing protein [Bacteroidia bacterium]|jgi:hypothetical protein|nr:T9SS type A sorting domain-containing protein [Bacteroidia bacterium]
MKNHFLLLSSIGIFLTFTVLGQAPKYTVTIDRNLNSSKEDFAPRYIDSSGQAMVFSSTRDGGSGNLSNIYYTSFQNNVWTSPIALITNNDITCNYGVVSFDTKRKVIFFTRCDIVKHEARRCKIYYSFMQGDLIGEQFPLDIEMNGDVENNDYTFGHPYFSSDIDVLFFASSMPGGYGGIDIWFSKYNRKTDTWAKAQNAGPDVNTEKSDLYPSVSLDGTLYFTSNGHGGYGGYDIFKATKTGELKWSNVENMGQPINSDSDDFAIAFKPGSASGYFSSNRKGGVGSDDIYSFSPENTKPVPYQFLFSTVTVKDTAAVTKKNALAEVLNKSACTSNIDSLQITEAKVYPNPNRGEFTFECLSNKYVSLTLRIYTSLGKVVTTESINLNQGKFSKLYDLQNQSRGIYYVQLLYGCESVKTVKVIVD